eukprot:365784-Chlamydomonas_euryale.AAC.7
MQYAGSARQQLNLHLVHYCRAAAHHAVCTSYLVVVGCSSTLLVGPCSSNSPADLVLWQVICKSEHQKACPARHRKEDFRGWRDAQWAKRQLEPPSKAEVTVMIGWLQHDKKELHFSSMAVAALRDKEKGLRKAVILYDNDATAVVAIALLGHDPGCAAAPRRSFVLQTVQERAALTALSSLNCI